MVSHFPEKLWWKWEVCFLILLINTSLLKSFGRYSIGTQLNYYCLDNVNQQIKNITEWNLGMWYESNRFLVTAEIDSCPLWDKCLTANVVYQATVKKRGEQGYRFWRAVEIFYNHKTYFMRRQYETFYIFVGVERQKHKYSRSGMNKIK